MSMRDIKKFGLAHRKGEGAPLHPDDIEADLTNEQIQRQAKSYFDYWRSVGVSEEILRQEFLYVPGER